MVYKRRYYKKPQSKQGRVQIYGRAGKQLYKDVMYLKTLINSEPHYHLLSTSGNIDNAGVVISLNDIPSGDSDINRTGTSVLPRWQSVNMHVNKKLTPVGTVDHETIRVILFRFWGEQASSAPAVITSEILESATNPLSFLDDNITGSKGDRERRIEVVKSKLFTLDSVASTSRTFKYNIAINGPNKQVKEHLKFRSTVTENPVSGGFYLLFLSDNGTGANKSSYTVNAKVNFYDN